MTRTEKYKFILEWLSKEPNVDLVIPYIKEKKFDLPAHEVNWLRKRVVKIKKEGHENYCANMTQALIAAAEVFGEEVRVVG